MYIPVAIVVIGCCMCFLFILYITVEAACCKKYQVVRDDLSMQKATAAVGQGGASIFHAAEKYGIPIHSSLPIYRLLITHSTLCIQDAL